MIKIITFPSNSRLFFLKSPDSISIFHVVDFQKLETKLIHTFKMDSPELINVDISEN